MTEDNLRAIEAPCGECGEVVEITQPTCPDCTDYELPALDELESAVVSKDDLRELVEKWNSVENMRMKPHECADDLENLIGGDDA